MALIIAFTSLRQKGTTGNTALTQRLRGVSPKDCTGSNQTGYGNAHCRVGDSGYSTSIKPHSMAHFTIVAPNVQSMPPIGAGVRIVAFTTHPAALSVSALSLPDILHTV